MRPALLPFILVTSLFAQNYSVEKSHTTEDLRGVSVPAANIAWASGTHGTYLRWIQSDWQVAHVPGAEALDFRDVEAFTSDFAYLLAAGPGELSRIYKTTDAGQHWSLQFTNHDPKGFLDCMAFWDRDHGIAVGDPVPDASGQLRFFLISTEDGGTTWNPIPSAALPPAIEGEGAFAASGTCIAVQGKSNAWFATGGAAARVFRSSDNGKSWAVASTPIAHGPASAGIFSIAFRDPQNGVIAGGDYKLPQQDGPNLAFTANGGLTWELSRISPQAYFSAVAFPPLSGFAPPHLAARHPVVRTASWILSAEPAAPSAESTADVFPILKHRDAPVPLFALGSDIAAYTPDIRRDTWQKTFDLHLNALSISPTGEAIAVGPNGLIVTFSAGH